MLLVDLVGRRALVLVGISWSVVLMRWLLQMLVLLLTGGLLLISLLLLASVFDAWMADVACPIVYQLVWPACWLDTPDRSSSSATRAVQYVWDVYRDELGEVPGDVVLALRDAVSRSTVDDFWT